MSDKFCDRLSYHNSDDEFVPVGCKKHLCERYQMVQGKDPQNGADIAHWDCAYNWTNILLIENSQRQMQTAESVQSFRNEMVSSNEETIKRLLIASSEQLRVGQQ